MITTSSKYSTRSEPALEEGRDHQDQRQPGQSPQVVRPLAAHPHDLPRADDDEEPEPRVESELQAQPSCIAIRPPERQGIAVHHLSIVTWIAR